jgi:hypothetical protein
MSLTFFPLHVGSRMNIQLQMAAFATLAVMIAMPKSHVIFIGNPR